MKKTILIVFGLITTNFTYAGDTVDLHETASSDGMVRIINVRGDVDVIGWDRDEITIQGELDDLAEKLIFEVQGKRTVIEVKLPKRNISWGDGSELEIKVPRGSKVDFEGVSTDISFVGIHGGLRVKSVSGDIVADNIHDRIMIDAVSGEVQIETSEGSLHASTVSGDLDIRSHRGDVNLASVSGEIELFSMDSEKLRARNVSGGITITTDLLEGAFVEIGTVSGDIELELTNEVNAHFQIDAGIGGEIYNAISDHEPTSSFPGGERLDMTLGNGSAKVSIRAVSADIRLE